MDKRLFGGALLAAGLAHGAADARDLSFSYSYTVVGAYAYGVSGPSYDAFGGAGFWSIAASEPGAIATSAGTAQSILISAMSDEASGAFAYDFITLFTVTNDVLGKAAWDFDAGFGSLTIDNITDSINLVSEFVGAGSIQFSLEAGKSSVEVFQLF